MRNNKAIREREKAKARRRAMRDNQAKRQESAAFHRAKVTLRQTIEEMLHVITELRNRLSDPRGFSKMDETLVAASVLAMSSLTGIVGSIGFGWLPFIKIVVGLAMAGLLASAAVLKTKRFLSQSA
jgi:hypothetical protein